jgi:hypothetical protein
MRLRKYIHSSYCILVHPMIVKHQFKLQNDAKNATEVSHCDVTSCHS